MSAEINETIKVYVRQRPVISSESQITVASGLKTSGIRSVSSDGTKCSYYAVVSNSVQEFKMDKIFQNESLQSDIYDIAAKPLISSALQGYSGTIFAYGPTNSGKTFTMRGGEGEQKGIMPRCIEQLLAERTAANSTAPDKITILASYVQIYCENLSDLLASSAAGDQTTQLSIREKGGTVFVEGLSRVPLTSIDDLWELLARGDENRNTAATNANLASSRSHAALMVHIMIKDDDEGANTINNGSNARIGGGTHKESTLMLVDLAGSERATASDGQHYMRLEEAKAINLSLSALGNCMSALAEGKAHIPYRDSKLTRLLQGCLGGSSRTAVVVNIPPGEDSTGEILSALRFASRAGKVKVAARVRRCRDFEAMYLEARKALDQLERSKGDPGSGNSAGDNADAKLKQLRLEHEDQLRLKESELEQQRGEAEALRQQVMMLQALTRAPATSSSSTEATCANETEWKLRLAELSEQHVRDLSTATRTLTVRCEQHKASERRLAEEVSTLQDEISADRQQLLTSMQDLRQLQERKVQSERELQGRVEELLAELEEKRGVIDSLAAANDDLQARLAQAEAGASEMVSRDQVREMEGLFVDTVTKLSARVNFLEAQQKQQLQQLQQQQQQPQVGATVGTRGHGVAMPPPGERAGQSNQSGQYQTSSNNNSRIKIEPGGKIRAVSLNSATGATGATGSGSGLPYRSASSEALGSAASSGTSGTGVGAKKLW